MTAAANGHTARVKYLLRLGADIDLSDERGLTALHHAAYSGWEDTVETLISNGANSEAQAELWGTPLHLAAVKGRINIIRLLLRYRAVVNSGSGLLGSPLHCACIAGDVACATALLDSGASLDTTARVHVPSKNLGGTDSWTIELAESSEGTIYESQPILLAVTSNFAQLVDLVLLRGACANSKTKWQSIEKPGLTFGDNIWHATGVPALAIAAEANYAEICRLLLKAGAEIDAFVEARGTALYGAASYGCYDACEVLLAGGADMDGPLLKGWSPLTSAAYYGRKECVQLFVKSKVSGKTSWWQQEVMEAAVRGGHVEIMEALREHRLSAMDYNDPERGSLLHMAIANFGDLAKQGKALAMVRYLLAQGVSPLLQGTHGRTSLDTLIRVQSTTETTDEHLALYQLLREAANLASRNAALNSATVD